MSIGDRCTLIVALLSLFVLIIQANSKIDAMSKREDKLIEVLQGHQKLILNLQDKEMYAIK